VGIFFFLFFLGYKTPKIGRMSHPSVISPPTALRVSDRTRLQEIVTVKIILWL